LNDKLIKNDSLRINNYKFKVDGKILSHHEVIDYFLSHAKKQTDPEIREKYINYADRYFMVIMKKYDSNNEHKISWPLFIVGCVLLLASIVLGFWGFSKEILTDDQKQIFSLFFSLAAGFSSGSFYGSIKVKTEKLFLKALSVTATGGFAVWFLTFYLLLPSNDSSFYHTCYIEEVDNLINRKELNGRIILKFPAAPAEFSVSNGFARIEPILKKYQDKTIEFSLEVNGVSLVDTNLINLTLNSSTTIKVKKVPIVPESKKPKTFRIEDYNFDSINNSLQNKLGVEYRDVSGVDFLISLKPTREIEPAVTSGLYKIRKSNLAIHINGKFVTDITEITFPAFWEPGYPKSTLEDTMNALMYKEVANKESLITKHIAAYINKNLY
jgi:hypothetical protein